MQQKFIGLLFLAFTAASCATTETVTEHPEQEEIEEHAESSAPSWYANGVRSDRDSLAFYGFALSASADADDALELAVEQSNRNLRFEIDRYSEEVRKKAAESGDPAHYQSSQFIINLRNSIQGLDLSGAVLTVEKESEKEGIYRVYVKTSLKNEEIHSLVSTQVDDEIFSRFFLDN